MTALAINSVGNVQDKLSWIFTAYDIDNNGYIDKDEFRKIIRVS
jgi:Ca2+-binding EF-hand superfamily protein